MQNGKGISELIRKLREADVGWERFAQDEKGTFEEEAGGLYNRLLGALCQEMKKGNPQEMEGFLREEGVGGGTAALLVEKIQEMLKFYYSFSWLRELEDRDATALKGLLSTIYQKHIVRFEPGYLNRMAAGRYDSDKLADIADRIAYLTDYYIFRNYTTQEMVRDLQNETGLSQESCGYWADLIEQNYTALKMNYIVEELGRIRSFLAGQ